MVVDFDEIEIMHPDIGGGNVYYFKGQPFTGTIVEYFGDTLIGEISVANGHKQGRSASYYNNGQIMEELFEKFNRMYGIYKKWDENGNLIIQNDYGPEP